MFSLKTHEYAGVRHRARFAALFVYVNSSALQAGEPDNHEMIATTTKLFGTLGRASLLHHQVV